MKKTLNLLFFILLITLVLPVGSTVHASEDIYDVILFCGQSNMTGYAGLYEWERNSDLRIDNVGIEKFSELTGIRKEIIENTFAVNYTKIEQEEGTVFEYIYSDTFNSEGITKGKLKEINEDVKKIGQKLTYNIETGLLEQFDKEKHDGVYSLQKSYGTNIIPEFCREYYKRTGHKVVIVMCANGGEEIADFLPYTDKDYGENDEKHKQFIYESMVEKYTEAIKFLEQNNYKIGQKIYVVSQARSDILDVVDEEGKRKSEKRYEEIFAKIDDYLEKDLGITKGAMILNGSIPENKSSGIYEAIQGVHDAQIKLIERDDIILGSAFQYENYVPRKAIYESEEFKTNKFIDSEGNKLSYEDALRISRYSLCSPYDVYEDGTKFESNENHFTSAALSQIGYEVATNFTKVTGIEVLSKPIKEAYYVGDNLDITGLTLNAVLANGINKEITEGFICMPTRLEEVGNQEIIVMYEGEISTFNVEVFENEKVVTQIEVVKEPIKTKYYVGDNLDISGLVINVIYEDGSSHELTRGFKYMQNILEEVGEHEIIVTYKEKIAKFNVVVEPNVVTEIKITRNPTKLEYIEGDKLDTSGLKIKVTYANGEAKSLTRGFTCTPTILEEIGEQEIFVEYEGITTKFNVKVLENIVTKVVIKNEPNKLEYIEGDKLDTTGLKIRVKYLNETVKDITSGFICTPERLNNVGTQKITVKYEGKSKTFNVNVLKNIVTEIKIVKKPNKLNYIVGDKINTSGLKIQAIYLNGATTELTKGFTCTPTKLEKSGTQKITLNYEGKSKTFNVNVVANTVTKLDIITKPSKLNYKVGNTLNTNGLKIKATYLNGATTELTSGFSCTPTKLEKSGTQKIIVTYEGISTEFNIQVEETIISALKNSVTKKVEETKNKIGNLLKKLFK